MNFNYDSIPNDIRTKLHKIGESACSTRLGIEHTFLMAEHLIKNNVIGDFVECGVAAGAQVGSMSLAVKVHGDKRLIHLFDSFEGIPLAGPHDRHQPGLNTFLVDVNLPIEERLRTSGVSIGTAESVRNHLKIWGFNPDDYKFHKGWFQHVLPDTTIGPIALLRLDGDLYESTKVCLEYLYPKVVKGGIVIIDDYALLGCREAVDEYLESNNLKPLIYSPTDYESVCWQV